MNSEMFWQNLVEDFKYFLVFLVDANSLVNFDLIVEYKFFSGYFFEAFR